MTDQIAERVQQLDMLAALRQDNKTFATRLRKLHNVREQHRDVNLPPDSSSDRRFVKVE